MKKRLGDFLLALVLLVSVSACGPKALSWQEQYDLGVRYLEEGDYEEAILAFTAAIEIDPKRAEAYVGRGDAYVLSGESRRNLRAAQKDYETAMELDETLAEAYLGLADVYIRRGDNDKALEILQQGYEKTKDSDKLTEKIEEIEREGIAGKNEAPIDILSGFWKSNGYRLSDTYVYQFRPDGTYICQVGMMSIPFYRNYEYNGHTLTLVDEFYQNEEVYEYDTEKQCFISSNTTVMVEQDSDNAEGVFKYAEKTLSFQAEAPIGFFEDEADGYDPTASGNVQGDYDKALEILQEALEISGDTRAILDTIEDLEKNKSNDLYIENYKVTLGQYPEYADKGWGAEYTEYTLYDIDKNGIPELIIKEPEIWNYVIYTFDGTESVQCGELWDSCFGTYAELYEYEGNGVLIHGGGMGSDRVEYIYVQQLIDNRLTDGELSASTEDISFDKLYDMLDDYTPINNFHHSSDLSLLGG